MGHQETVKERGSQFWIPLPPVQTLALEPEHHQRHNRKRNRAVLTKAVNQLIRAPRSRRSFRMKIGSDSLMSFRPRKAANERNPDVKRCSDQSIMREGNPLTNASTAFN